MDEHRCKTIEICAHGTISEISVNMIHEESGSSATEIIIASKQREKKRAKRYKSNLKGTCCTMDIWCHPGTFEMPRMTSFMFPILCNCDVSQKQYSKSEAMIPRMNIMFPLLTQETVDGMEALLKMDKEYRDLLIEDLYYLESGPLVTYTKRIMIVLFSKDVLNNYSFKTQILNQSIKKSFSELKICQVIIDAIRKHEKYRDDYSEIELKIKAYLTQISYPIKFRKNEELNNNKKA